MAFARFEIYPEQSYHRTLQFACLRNIFRVTLGVWKILKKWGASVKNLMGQMGEPFLTFHFTSIQASMAGQKVTEFVWSKKPRARQAVPKRVFNRIREHLEPRQSHFGILELGPGTGRFSQEAVHTFSGVTTYALIDSDKS